MNVSIIIPNNGKCLTNALESIKRSTVPPSDLLIIDKGLERSLQRNMGISEAVGNCFLFLDSDQSISPGLLAECIELIKLGYNCIYIPEVIIAKSFFGKIRAFERSFLNGTHVDVPRFVRADACPKFDESLTGPEDADWGNRIKGFRTVSKNVLYHHDDISFKEYCRKKAYYTKSMKAYVNKWPYDPCINIKYRCCTVFTEKGKWKKLIRHPILTLGVIFLLAVRGYIYYANK